MEQKVLAPMAEKSLPEFVEYRFPVFDQDRLPGWKKCWAAEPFVNFSQKDLKEPHRYFDIQPKKRQTKTIQTIPKPYASFQQSNNNERTIANLAFFVQSKMHDCY